MDRRRFVALAGAVVATGGCTGGPSTADGSTGAPADTPVEPTTSGQEGGRVAVSEPAVLPGFVALTTPDSIGVHDEAGQYLLLHAETEAGTAPERDAFVLEFDERSHRPAENASQLWYEDDYGVRYSPEEGAGWLVFALPETGSATDTRLRWPGGEWAPPDRPRNRLATPLPTFQVEFAAPATVGQGEEPALSISATNTGDVAGTCVLAVNRVGPNVAYTPVTDLLWDVEPGATASRELRGEAPTADRPVTYHLRGAGVDRRSRTIELAVGDGDGSTSTASGNSA